MKVILSLSDTLNTGLIEGDSAGYHSIFSLTSRAVIDTTLSFQQLQSLTVSNSNLTDCPMVIINPASLVSKCKYDKGKYSLSQNNSRPNHLTLITRLIFHEHRTSLQGNCSKNPIRLSEQLFYKDNFL